MSRCGRAIELLSQWRDHPRGCKEEHGFRDGYAGPCMDDPWDVAQALDDIDPFFRRDENERLRKLLKLVAPAALDAHDACPAKPAIEVVRVTEHLFAKDLWENALSDRDRETRLAQARKHLAVLVVEEGAVLTGFSEVEEVRAGFGAQPLMAIHGHGYKVRPQTVGAS